MASVFEKTRTVGGLIFSQMLTLWTTPVAYLYLDRPTRRRRAL
jgi:hypothetical protein